MNRRKNNPFLPKAQPGESSKLRPPSLRPLAAYQPFPVEALPPVARDSVLTVARSIGCDPAFAALPALALAGAAVGAALAACPKPGFAEVSLLWAVVVGDSGTAKSPAAAPFEAIAERIEDVLEADHSAKLSAREAALEVGGKSSAHPAPAREYFRCDDITLERLVENLRSSPRGLLVMQDELAGWLGSFTRYRGKGGGSDAPKWLSMFDAKSVAYQRRTGHPRDVRVRRAAVAVTGGIQPAILRDALADPSCVASGLTARMVFAYPPKRCPRWSDTVPDQAVLTRFEAAVRFLRGIPFNPAHGPVSVGLEMVALDRFQRFHNRLMERADSLDGGPMAAALPKLSRIGLRLALIHHTLTQAAAGRDPGKSSIAEESMTAGLRLADWFQAEAERVYAMMAERPEDAAVRRLAELVERKGGRMTARDLQRTNTQYPTSEAAEAALDGLVTAGLGEWTEMRPPHGGHPKRVLVLCSTLDTRPETNDTSAGDHSTLGPEVEP